MRAQPGVRRALLPPLVLLGVVLGGCTSESPVPPSAGPTGPTVVPLEEVDLSGVAAVRAPFCDALDESALETVLGGRPAADTSYGPGDRVPVTPSVRDVVNEYGCAFERAGTTARAWLFAPPVTRGQARAYVAERRQVRGCAPAGVLRFGSPGLVQLCHPQAAPGARVAALSGLFGSGYLTCRLAAPATVSTRADLLARAERWCASVATTVGTP